MSNATRLLTEIQHGNAEAATHLLDLIKLELHQMAGKIWGGWQHDQTLQPTLLMDMAWEKLVGFEGDLKKIVPTTFLPADIKDVPAMVRRLSEAAEPVSEFLKGRLTPGTIQLFASLSPAAEPGLAAALAGDLNEVVKGPGFYDETRFGAVVLREETREMLARMQPVPTGSRRLNRLLLEDAYPVELSRALHKEQFLRFAAVTMKRILWEAREKRRLRPPMEGGDALGNFEGGGNEEPADRLLAVQDALDELAVAHPQAGRLVKLLCYDGKSLPEAASDLGLTLITARRRWDFAKAWLFKKLNGNGFS